MSQAGDRAEMVMALALIMFNETGGINPSHLRDICEQHGIHMTEMEAQAAAEEMERMEKAIGIVGGQSRVCPCGLHRVYVRQTCLWVCPKCQRSISIEASRN